MSDVLALFVVLGGLHVLDGLAIVAPDAVVFRRVTRSYRAVATAVPLGTRRALVWASPLPPLAPLFVAPEATSAAGRADGEGARALVARYERATGTLGWSCQALFGYLFVVAPAAAFRLGLDSVWPYLLAGLLALQAGILLLFLRAHRALGGAGESAWSHGVAVLLSPLSALRARDGLARDLVAGFDPVAAAYALCPREEFLRLAARALRESRFPIPGTSAGRSREVETGLAALVRHAGEDPERLVRGGPPRESEATRSYCPRCWTQYVVESGTCRDCTDLPLVCYKERLLEEGR